MVVGSTERTQLARLFSVLAAGEALAEECATGQARLANDAGSRRFFLAQARQEALHRQVFEGILLWLCPRGSGNAAARNPHIRIYRKRVLAALQRGDLVETLLAQQVVLEGLGEAVLEQVDGGIGSRGFGFAGMRRMLLRQEKAHHRFGLRELQRLVDETEASPIDLRDRAGGYFALSEALLESYEPLFDFFEEDPIAYARNARRALPAWMRD